MTSYEYLVGSALPEVLPGCDERIANTWLTPQAPGLAEVHPLQNLSPETEMLVAVRSLRVANGFTFYSDWAVAMPEPTGCAAPLRSLTSSALTQSTLVKSQSTVSSAPRVTCLSLVVPMGSSIATKPR